MFPRLPGIFDPPEPEQQAEPPPDPELALDAPLDSKVFLRAVVDQKNPVVGEQVTLTIYVYARQTGLELTDSTSRRSPTSIGVTCSRRNNQPEPRPVSIGGVIWRAQPIFKAALFPLKSGEIDIGPDAGHLRRARQRAQCGPRQPDHQAACHRAARTGRPVGYQMGDVGSYSLSATVDPRKTEVGGAIAVTMMLVGVGNVPNAINMPPSSALEWLEPQVREDIEVENGKIRGSRTFSYVVRPKTAGTVDLGEATLPYWNPDHKVYDIARAYIGKMKSCPMQPKRPTKTPHLPTILGLRSAKSAIARAATSAPRSHSPKDPSIGSDSSARLSPSS